jgi:hypothetical protein
MLIDKDKVSAVGQDLTSLATLSSTLPQSLCATVSSVFLSNNLLATTAGIDVFSSVQILSISNNRLMYWDALNGLQSLPKLRRLSLLGNLVTKLPFYREIVLSLCSQLESLDGSSVSDLERVQSKLRFRQFQQLFSRATDNFARNTIAVHMLNKLYCHQEMNRKIFCRMR